MGGGVLGEEELFLGALEVETAEHLGHAVFFRNAVVTLAGLLEYH